MRTCRQIGAARALTHRRPDVRLPTIALIVNHTVADFDAWKGAFDAVEDARRSASVVGHAANRSLDDPSMAIVYHQAESFDELHSFLDGEDLKAVMENAGVTSEPQVSFYNGGWGKKY